MDKRIRSLDSLRAIAILMVLLAHTIKASGAPEIIAPLQIAGNGVDLFFVLSGWLLGSFLYKQGSKEGINVINFWKNRWLRTLPLYYSVLTLTIIQQTFKENPKISLEYYFLIQNYIGDLDILYVSWSLAVEEQFYLFIAPIMFLIFHIPEKFRIPILIITTLLPFFFRELDLYNNLQETHVRADGCIMGVTASYIYHSQESVRKFVSRNNYSLLLITIFSYTSFIAIRYISNENFQPNYLYLSLIFTSLLLFSISSDRIKVGFYIPGFKYIATRSYAIYLLHPESYALSKIIGIDEPTLFFIFSIFTTLVISEIAYQIVEVPAEKYRKYKHYS